MDPIPLATPIVTCMVVFPFISDDQLSVHCTECTLLTRVLICTLSCVVCVVSPAYHVHTSLSSVPVSVRLFVPPLSCLLIITITAYSPLRENQKRIVVTCYIWQVTNSAGGSLHRLFPSLNAENAFLIMSPA